MTRLELACGGDAGYLEHTAAMLSSVLEHRDGLEVRVHYLHDPRLDPAKARTLADWLRDRGAEPRLLAVDADRLEGLPERRGHLTPAMWYRVFLPDLLPDLDRVLYLDPDLLAVGSLAPLWAVDIGDAPVAAVTNVFDPWNAGYAEAVGLSAPYFNSGVLIVNLARMRADGARARILEYAREHADRMPWGDQDPLNAVLGAERVELHPRWNCMNSFHVYPEDAARVLGPERRDEAVRDPAIRHFEGPGVNKPWHVRCERPGAEEYFRHRARTPWPEVKREGSLWDRVRRLARRP